MLLHEKIYVQDESTVWSHFEKFCLKDLTVKNKYDKSINAIGTRNEVAISSFHFFF